jgi:hypothetical protein
MPLTADGKKVLKEFQQEYGKDEGRSIFYAYMNKHRKETKGWHK